MFHYNLIYKYSQFIQVYQHNNNNISHLSIDNITNLITLNILLQSITLLIQILTCLYITITQCLEHI